MKKLFLLTAVILFSFAAILPSCTKDEETSDPDTPTGVTINGFIKNVTESGVSGAVVSFSSATKTFTGTTDDDGNYQISGIIEGNYSVTVESTGYINTVDSDISVISGSSHEFTLLGAANISGKILNSQTGQGIEGVEIIFTSVDGKSSKALNSSDFRIYSNSQGIYQINQAPTGRFNVVFDTPGFFDNSISDINLTAGENDLGESTIVEEVNAGEIRIVLTWGESPNDLDTHLTGPNSSGDRFHIFYQNKTVNDGTEAYLDVDDTYSWGPETITIHQYLPGVYRYSVYNFSDQGTEGGLGIYNSPTKVEIFNSDGIVASYTPKPFVAGSGNTWRVFEFTIENDNISVTSIDEYFQANSSGDMGIFKTSNKKIDVKFNSDLF